MKRIFFVTAMLGVGASHLLAATTYAFLNGESGTQNVFDGEAISPYGGATGTSLTESSDTAVQLFCDDNGDTATWGTHWAANLTTVSAGDAALKANTRYGTNYSSAGMNSNFPSATALYEEVAWLFTQELVTGQTLANDDSIQEAVWLLTSPKGATEPHSAANIAGWISAAQTYYGDSAAQTPVGYDAVDYSKWTVVTDVGAVGKITGGGNQEFLAYTPGNSPGTGGTLPKAPEPATFLLFGTGLAVVGLLSRRKKQANS